MSTKFPFSRGDTVNALGMIGVIRDVLESSQETGNVCVYVSFVHNIGNARAYDMLELTPDDDRGTGGWCLASESEWESAIRRKEKDFFSRLDSLEAARKLLPQVPH